MTNPTACLLVIGNEVLSGRTQDANIKFLALGLGGIGIPLREVRVIPDVPETIINTVNEVRAKFDYVFTTGGIGPTHDDITSECVAAAFGVPWEPQPEAWARMERSYKPGEFNAARQRMATMPRGAALIDNALSVAPGFQIGNVYVMAGVPRVMQSMFEWLAPRLKGGAPNVSNAVHSIGLPEGMIAEGLAAIQARYPQIDLGSYPFYRPSGNGVALVAKGADAVATKGNRRGHHVDCPTRQDAGSGRTRNVTPTPRVLAGLAMAVLSHLAPNRRGRWQGTSLRRIAAGRHGGADGDGLRRLWLSGGDRAAGSDSTRLSSVPVPGLRHAVQRAQRRCPQSSVAAERHHRLRGVLPAALQADTAGSQRDHAVARVHCQP